MTALAPGFYDIPPGKIAAVVTHLEMDAQAPSRHVSAPDGWEIVPVPAPDVAWYRDLYRAVGQEWLWFSRLRLDDAALLAEIQHDAVDVFALRRGSEDGGLIELDFRAMPRCELAFFGVTQALIGTTAARHMMNFAIARAWERAITQLYVHTCTFDSPKAVGFYQRSGFVASRFEIEVADDPRLDGVYGTDRAPHIPLIGTE